MNAWPDRGQTASPATREAGGALTTDSERDRQLLARVAVRDSEAFKQLYHIYHRRLSRFLMRLTRQPEVAEEIINDTLWIVWRKAPEFRYGSLVSTWILGIAWRRGLKTLQRQPPVATSLELDTELETADDVQPVQERADWLERALGQLPVNQRAALELSYYLGHSCEEIAQIMDCPVSTVKTRMYKARQKMKILLGGFDR
jgi:RNA polymerase sigma-70 factor (ECF subfamily)